MRDDRDRIIDQSEVCPVKMSSRAKDASSKLHEKHQTILANMLKDEDNKFCADCRAKGSFTS